MAAHELDRHGFLLPPPLIFALAFLLGVGLQRLWPLPPLAGPAWRPIAVALGIAGWGLALSSLRRFVTAGTTFTHLRPSCVLVVRGPYRFTRNPMYLGLTMVYVACACWIGQSWALLLTPVAFWLLDAWIVRTEERHLRRSFGQEYESYVARVRRWI